MKICAQTDFWQFCLLLAEKKGHETEDGQAIPVFASNKVKYKLKNANENEKRSIIQNMIRVLKKSRGEVNISGFASELCVQEQDCPRAGGKYRKLHTVTVLGCLCCERKMLLHSGTKQQELHSAALCCTPAHLSCHQCPVVLFQITSIVLKATEGHDSFRI